MLSLTVATWNIQAIRGASDARLSAIAETLAVHRPDVVILQEVSARPEAFERLAAWLAAAGLSFTHFSGVGADDYMRSGRRKRYGNVIASRWPLTPVTWPVSASWPQLIAAADMDVPGHRIRLVSVHAPNGSGNGWDKVRALEALRDGLAAAPGPGIVAGDFNEPRTFAPGPISFRAGHDGSVEGDWTDKFGETHPRARWQGAVASVLGDDASAVTHWPGTLATRQAGVAPEVTHVVPSGEGRMFDHVLVAPPAVATAVRYVHEVRLGDTPLSDHSLVVAEVALLAVESRQGDRVGAVETPYGRLAWTDGPLTDAALVTLEHDGEWPPRALLLGSLIAQTNGEVLRYLL